MSRSTFDEGRAGPRHAKPRRRRWRLPVGIAAAVALLGGTGGLLFAPTANASLDGTVHGTAALVFPTVQLTHSLTKTATIEWTTTVTIPHTASAATVFTNHITGADATEFAVTSVACTTLNQICTIGITFTPSTTPENVGLQTATLAVPGNYANYPFHIALSGTVGYRAIRVAPSPVTFGTVQDGTSVGATLTVTNTGNESLTLASPGTLTSLLSGPDKTSYKVQLNTCASKVLLADSANSCKVRILFSPTAGASGLKSAVLTVPVTPAESSTTVGTPSAALHGTASNTPPTVTVSPFTEVFGNVPVGATAISGLVTVVNHGQVSTKVTVSNATGTGFSVVNGGSSPCAATPTATTIAPGTSCTFKVRFAPTTAGPATGQVTVSGSFGSQAVSLSGTGTQPGATVVTSSGGTTLVFPPTPVGETSTGWIKITNTGNAALTFGTSTILYTGPTPTPLVYGTTDGCALQTIQPTHTCTVFVSFTPSTVGQAPAATYQVTDNASPALVTVPLSGTGTNPLSGRLTVSQFPASPSGTPGVIDFGSVGVGTTKHVRAKFTNHGSAPAKITKVRLTDPTDQFGGSATLTTLTTDRCLTKNLLVYPGIPSSCIITLKFTPTSPGTPESATLAITFKTTSGAVTRTVTQNFPLEGIGFGITTLGLPTGTVGVPYQATLTTAGGTGPYAWSRYSGTLPPGISLNSSTGELSGTPTKEGSFTFTVQVKEANGQVNRKTFTIDIFPPPLVVTPDSLATAVVGRPYSTSVVTASGGTPPYTYTEWGCKRVTPHTTGTHPSTVCVVTGAGQEVPPGMSFDPNTGVLSGSPTTQGRFELKVRVTDSSTFPAPKVQTVVTYLSIVPPTLAPVPVTLPAATVGKPYAATFSAMGGTPPYTFSGPFTSVDGLTVTTTIFTTVGDIAGTPVDPGTFHVLVTITDSSYYPTGSAPQTATETLTVIVKPLQLAFGPATLPSGQVGVPYTGTLTVTGATPGTTPYTFRVYSGSLPPGLSLTTTATHGKITGTPTKAGAYSFGVEVTDSSVPAQDAYATYTITVAPVPPLSVTGTLPSGQVSTFYSGIVTASGGTLTGRYTFTVTSGTLPTGLTLVRTPVTTTTAVLSGTPTKAGTFTFTVTVTDHSSPQRFGSASFTVTIASLGPLTLMATPVSPASCTVGVTCTVDFRASGGTGMGYHYFRSGGSFPPGLALTGTTGVLTGKPTRAGTFSFSVEVEDSAHHLAHIFYKIIVAT